MKRLYLLFVILSLAGVIFGQPPQKLSYQAVIRKSTGSLVANQTVGMKISILQGSVTGTAVYVETQTKLTDANGLVTLEIGGGTPVKGIFADITWKTNPFFIKTETDPKGGTNYSITGTGQILSVPYALYAASAPPTTNANAISSGTLDPLYYSAYNDLIEEGRLDNTTGADILTRTQADARYNQKIGFFAYNSEDDYNYTLDTHKIEFNQEVFDDGNCFDNTKDRFVAPVAGVYSFSVTLRFDNPSFANNTFHYIYLSKNGKRYCLLEEIESENIVVVRNSINLKLGVSDYIEIEVDSPQLKIYGDFSSPTEMVHRTFFSGHLVYPTSF